MGVARRRGAIVYIFFLLVEEGRRRFIGNAAMALKDVLEDFIKYKINLDDLDKNGTESSSAETYEKQFFVRIYRMLVLKSRKLARNLAT